jgi:hypothetical protein
VTRRALIGVAVAIVVLAGVAVLAQPRRGHDPPTRASSGRAVATARTAGTRAVVWAVGDGADGSDAARAVADRIAADEPDRLLYLGDVYEHGAAVDFRRRYDPVYGKLARITAPTPGNHDWPAHRDGYDPYWKARTGAAMPHWYAFSLGGWRIISLNSEASHEPGSAQLQWLRSELRRRRGTCTLAFWHRPRFSAGRHGDQADVAPLWDALRGHVRLVITGHDHDLQRLRPRDGMTQLVAGAGGKSHYGVDDGDRRLAFADDDHDGALRIELRTREAGLSFVAADGSVLDRSAVACSRRP